MPIEQQRQFNNRILQHRIVYPDRDIEFQKLNDSYEQKRTPQKVRMKLSNLQNSALSSDHMIPDINTIISQH